jgi:Tol biopolymer transport system component
MHSALQSARDADHADQGLIGVRDTAGDVVRSLELLCTDAKNALDYDIAKSTEPSVPAATTHRALPWATAVAASLLTSLAFLSLTRSEAPPVTRFSYDLPFNHELRSTSRPVLAVSPDGRQFVYNTTEGLYLRTMDQLEARLLPGTEEPLRVPIFSPDGRSDAFFQGGSLKRLPLSGSAPVVVCSVSRVIGASWAPDDTIFFAQSDGIMRVPANGGTPVLVVPAEEKEELDAPQLMPDRDSLLFSSRNTFAEGASWDDARIIVHSLSSGERTVLLSGGSDARYVPSGHLLYAVDTRLLAVAFDVESLSVLSGPVSMVEAVARATSIATSTANYAVSDGGDLFFLSGEWVPKQRLSWVNRDGEVEPLEAIPPSEYIAPRLSPDGERVLVVVDGDVRIYDLESGRESRLTTDGAAGVYADWTPSGEEVAYSANRGSEGVEVWIQRADGSGAARQVTTFDWRVHFDAWAPDGRTFSAHNHVGTMTNQLMVSFDGTDGEPETWLDREFSDTNAVFSPDGRYVALVSDQTGQRKVYIRPFPGPGGQTPVSIEGGEEAVWARNGELFYRRLNDYAMMVVEVTTDPALTVGAPKELFAGRRMGGTGGPRPRYAVTADGQRFLMSAALLPTGEPGARMLPKVVVVQNWIEELKERVPVN